MKSSSSRLRCERQFFILSEYIGMSGPFVLVVGEQDFVFRTFDLVPEFVVKAVSGASCEAGMAD
jgi:hypothetical protein